MKRRQFLGTITGTTIGVIFGEFLIGDAGEAASSDLILAQATRVSPVPVYNIRIHAIVTGTSRFTASDVQFLLNEVNQIYSLAGIRFVFNPQTDIDIEPGSPLSSDQSPDRTNRALQYRGKLVIFFRDIGGGFSGAGEYAAMQQVSNFDASRLLAHELGHYFNLHHTFVEGRGVVQARSMLKDFIQQQPEAQNALVNRQLIPQYVLNRGNPYLYNILDGDSADKGVPFPVEDTPPTFHEYGPGSDPTLGARQCEPNFTVPINVTFDNGQSYTYSIKPDQANIMGYYYGCQSIPQRFSPGQVRIMRQALEKGSRNHLIGPVLRWNGWAEVQGDGRTDAAPAAASLGNHLYVFVKGPTGLIFHNSARDGQAFGGWAEVQGNGRTDAAPAAASLGNSIYVFVKGPTGLIFHNSARDGQAFGGWAEVQGNGQTNASVAAVAFGNWLCLFSKGNDNRVYYNAAKNGEPFRGWNEVPGNGITDASPSVAVLNNRLYLFVKGPTGSIFCNSAELL
jgi:hypothetical protein